LHTVLCFKLYFLTISCCLLVVIFSYCGRFLLHFQLHTGTYCIASCNFNNPGISYAASPFSWLPQITSVGWECCSCYSIIARKLSGYWEW
jgi:hypothetical protein